MRKTIPTADSPAGEETLTSEKTHSGLADFEAVTTGSVVSHLPQKSKMLRIESFDLFHDLEHLDHVSSVPPVTQRRNAQCLQALFKW